MNLGVNKLSQNNPSFFAVYLYILSKVCLLPAFLSFLSTQLGFTSPQTLGAMYICLLLAGDHSPLPITLLSAVSELFSGILSVSIHISTVPRQNVQSALENTCCALFWGFIRIIYAWGPTTRHFTNMHTYIHLPRFRLHTA